MMKILKLLKLLRVKKKREKTSVYCIHVNRGMGKSFLHGKDCLAFISTLPHESLKFFTESQGPIDASQTIHI